MKKQNNYVAKHNFNKGGAHKDKSKEIPRDMKYDDKDIREFVDEFYSDGKRPCEQFGMSWEMLGHLEEMCSQDTYQVPQGLSREERREWVKKTHEEHLNDVQEEEKI